MKIRTKLFVMMSGLALFMAVIFYALLRIYVLNLFQQYAGVAEQSVAEQWARNLAYYYTTHQQSWNGANVYVGDVLHESEHTPDNHVEHITVKDTTGQVVFTASDMDHKADDADHDGDDAPPRGHANAGSMQMPIVANGETVGSVTVQDTGVQSLWVVEDRVLDSMNKAAFWGVLATTFIALLISAWLSGRVTNPLKRLLRTIEQIARGDRRAHVSVRSNDEFGLVATAFNDMTSKLFQAEEARRHVVADVAHELRTPLTIMQGRLELIQEGIVKADESAILPVLDEVMRLTRLVEDLHQLSLAETGVLPLDMQMVDLVQLVRGVVENFRLEADDKSMELRFESVCDGFTIRIDQNRITQVFVNVIGNALRYTPNGGHIHVSLTVQSNTVDVAVQDNGPGIDAKHAPFIFDRLYRGDDDRSRNTGGMGIGLAIAKEYVQAHLGTIDMQSEFGRGTTFTVRLPKP